MYQVYPAARQNLASLLLATTMLTGIATVPVAAQESTVRLPTVLVEGQRDQDTATTEGKDTYTSKTVTVGKDAIPVKEIPQSITVVTQQRMKDQSIINLEDAARLSPGTLVLQNDPGRSSIFSRGFEFDTYNIDGLPAPLSSVYGTQPDLAPFDRVEILRGPSGLFAGTGEPAGTLNLARKRALDQFKVQGDATIGSWNHKRGVVDITGPLTKNKSVRARGVVAFTDTNSFIDYAEQKVGVGYGTIEFDLTPQTTLSLALIHQEKDFVPQNGVPAYANGTFADLSRSTFSGASWNRFENRGTDVLAELNHDFDNGGHARGAVRYVDRFVDFKYAFGISAINPATGNYNMRGFARQYWEKSLSTDAHISLPFNLLGQTHNFMAGLDYRSYDQKMYQGIANNFAVNNVFSPNANVAEPSIPFTVQTQDKPTQTGFYGQLRLKPASWSTVILGGRVSNYKNTTTNLVSGATTDTTDINNNVTPYVGLVIDLNENISAYGVYTEIFQPQIGSVTAFGTPIEPRTGREYEAGLKGSFMGGALNASVAYFNTRDQNRAVNDLSNPGSSVAAGEAEVQGIEAELSGRLAPGWEVYAGYAYTISQYLNSVTVGATTYSTGDTFSTWTPKHTFNLWTKYAFQMPELAGWHVGGGLRALSSFYSQQGTVRFEENGYVVFDGQVGYKINENVDATFTVKNIADETYFTRVGSAATFNFYGEPRSFWLKISAKN